MSFLRRLNPLAHTGSELAEERIDTTVSRNGSKETYVQKSNDIYVQSSNDVEPAADRLVAPGELTFEEDTMGGLGRHLGLFSTTFLM